jgi:penicillin-binding protein 1C
VIERYYALNHPNYQLLPDFKPECLAKIADGSLHIVYPKAGSKIYVPIAVDGQPGKVIFEAGHRKNSTRVYWHLDDYYLGETKDVHQFSLNPPVGAHCLKLIDENGISTMVNFEIIGSSKRGK